MTQVLVPGNFVEHPDQPDWGLGQVQSVANGRATVNFEHAGKRTIVLANVTLTRFEPGDGRVAGPGNPGHRNQDALRRR